MDARALWDRYKACLCHCPEVGLSLDYSRMNFEDGYLDAMSGPAQAAFAAMAELEAGAIANPDEKRMVGHYWLRAPELAPDAKIKAEIAGTLLQIKKFTKLVHAGKAKPQKAAQFKNLLVVGIGGSALGPQFVSRALSTPKDKMKVFFFDNTDPDGMDYALGQIAGSGKGMKETLTVVISKSGGTKETRNGMLEAAAAYKKAGLKFERHAVAVTGEGSELDKVAVAGGWIARFPMWDWVGGRTSELAAVGLLPAALQGLDIDAMLRGAKAIDAVTRRPVVESNPAMLLALMWHHAGQGRGAKDMVILPYRDRLELFSKYLQQLVMESLGKEKDLNGKVVNQGIAVYGNKGSTDQHAYVQQLREGVNNFFATFIEVLRSRAGKSMQVEPGVTSGDFLDGFLQGTRKALYEMDRESMTLTVEKLDAETVGLLIALYERAVGFYATLVGINAYHQPGVEAGKKAAGAVIALQLKVVAHLKGAKGKGFTSDQVADALGAAGDVETIHWVLRHLAANPDAGVKVKPGKTPFEAKYSA
ncbi:MAG: glucose-6-phosphate isomerase [Planctomycetota bacterium]|nr:glucose-6-phosphate isomerase [Planctomycetota bacterium]